MGAPILTEAVGACKLSLIQRKVLELRKIISAFLPKNDNLSELYQGALPELYQREIDPESHGVVISEVPSTCLNRILQLFHLKIN